VTTQVLFQISFLKYSRLNKVDVNGKQIYVAECHVVIASTRQILTPVASFKRFWYNVDDTDQPLWVLKCLIQ